MLSPGQSGVSIDWDEIPGYTTYLYNKNRFRQDHEFIGQEADINLLQEISRLQSNIDVLKDKLQDKERRNKELEKEIRELKKTSMNLLQTYGGHTSECRYIEARLALAKPSESFCNCGWYERLQQI